MYSRVWSFFLCCCFFFFFVPAPLLFFYFSISSSLFIQSFFFFFCRFLVKHTNLLFFVFSLSNLFVALRWMFCVLLKPYVITCFLHFNSEMLLLLVLFASKLKTERGRENGIHCARKCWEICFVSIYFANLAPFYQQLKNIMFQFFQSIFPILFAFFNLRTARSDMNSDGIVWEIEQKRKTREREREQMGNMHVRYISRLPHTQHTHIQRQREMGDWGQNRSPHIYVARAIETLVCSSSRKRRKEKKSWQRLPVQICHLHYVCLCHIHTHKHTDMHGIWLVAIARYSTQHSLSDECLQVIAWLVTNFQKYTASQPSSQPVSQFFFLKVQNRRRKKPKWCLSFLNVSML